MAGEEGEDSPCREGLAREDSPHREGLAREYSPYDEGLARDLCREYAGYTRLSLAEEHGQVGQGWRGLLDKKSIVLCLFCYCKLD